MGARVLKKGGVCNNTAGHLPVSPVYLARFHVKLRINTWMRVSNHYGSFPVRLRGSGVTVTLVTIVITYPSVTSYVTSFIP